MYLYECRADGFRWGHVSSIDMVHWHAHPDILIPDELDGGIFSGGAFVDDDRTAYIAYWALANPNSGCGGIRLARSTDRKHFYEKWEKFPDYAIPCTDFGYVSVKKEDGLV